MNQPSTTAAAPRPAGVADAPDISFVLRRYIWLIVIGTILCTACAAVLWYYLYRTSPRYTATVTYQVLAPPIPPAAGINYQQAAPSPEEITRFIRRQIIYIKSDVVMDRALQTAEFQRDPRDPTSSRKSRWLTENIVQAKKHLREDLEVTPIPSSEVYLVNMTAKDPVEASELVKAVTRIYEDQLRSDSRLYQTQHLEQLANTLKDQEGQVGRLEIDLGDFRKANNIDAITPRYTLQLQVLGDLDRKLTEIQGFAIAAGQQLEAIKKQLETGTLQLSAEAEQRVENDNEIRYLSQSKLSLQQELVARRTPGAGTAAALIRELEARMSEGDRQMQERRQKVEAQARIWMQSTAQADFVSQTARAEYLKKVRDAKDLEVKDLDHWLVQAQQKADALKAQQDVLRELRQDFARERLKSSADDTRVRKLSDAIPPEDISWPIWYKFWVPAGFAIGLFLSFGMAYLFELTNTRVRTPYDITRTLQMPLLGFIPDQDDDSAVKGELSTSIRTAPSSMIAESFRQIRGRLIAEGDGNMVKTLLVASIAPGGGATTVASNIANGMALNEKRVLLVDANFYRPGLRHSYKNIPAIGLADVVASPDRLDAAIVASADMANLYLMGTGNIAATSPSEMFESKAFRELLDSLKSRYEMIVFDGAPLSLVSDSVALGARVDGVIAVVRAGEVSRGTVARVREQLRQVRAHFLGVVLNAAQTHGAGYFKENYRTFYKYAGQGARANGASVH